MTDAPIQIRNPEVVRDIRALAERLGLSMTDVVADAVRRLLAEEDARDGAARHARATWLAEVLAAIDALPHDGRPLSDDEIYDESGLPR
jgi:hypothetical protein